MLWGKEGRVAFLGGKGGARTLLEGLHRAMQGMHLCLWVVMHDHRENASRRVLGKRLVSLA